MVENAVPSSAIWASRRRTPAAVRPAEAKPATSAATLTSAKWPVPPIATFA